jgi:hypothetical protein
MNQVTCKKCELPTKSIKKSIKPLYLRNNKCQIKYHSNKDINQIGSDYSLIIMLKYPEIPNKIMEEMIRNLNSLKDATRDFNEKNKDDGELNNAYKSVRYIVLMSIDKRTTELRSKPDIYIANLKKLVNFCKNQDFEEDIYELLGYNKKIFIERAQKIIKFLENQKTTEIQTKVRFFNNGNNNNYI